MPRNKTNSGAKKRFMALAEDINEALAEWNPIGVPNGIAKSEYTRYVPIIWRSIENKTLLKCLEDILINKIGLDFNMANEGDLEDLKRISDKLIGIYNDHIKVLKD